MKAMEQPHQDHSAVGAYATILLTAFSWFMNFVTHADQLMQFLLHTTQWIAAICAILVSLSILFPSFKEKMNRVWKKINKFF
jgi:hypothetical protein